MNNKIFHLYSPITVEKGSKKKGLRIAGYANTTDKDRSGDIITADAWAKGIDNYRKNPVLLYQHKHDKPIGRVEKISVDRKGIHVEAYVSDAAETLHGVQTLINDGALKSFSVGFLPKNGKYDSKTETLYITEVELHEISVVSVPCNQESLFSVRKSFGTDEEYETFKNNLIELETEKAITTEPSNQEELTIIMNTEEKTVSEVEPVVVAEELVVEEKATEKEEQEDEEEAGIKISDNPYEPIPFISYLSMETSQIKINNFVKLAGKRFKVTEIATAQNPNFQFLEVDLNGKSLDNTITISAETLSIVNFWEIGSQYDLDAIVTDNKQFTDQDRINIKEKFKLLVTLSEQELYSIKDKLVDQNNGLFQEKLNKTLNILATPSIEWNDTIYSIANVMNNNITKLMSIDCEDGKETSKDLALLVNGHKTTKTIKENNKMATENAGDPIVIVTEKKAAPEPEAVKNEATVIKVVENRAETLVQKTGEAVINAANEEDRDGEASRKAREELQELRAQLVRYKEEVKSVTESKMHYQEQNRKSQFSAKEMANAYLLAKALNRKDEFDTRLGAKIKAVTSVDAFISNFSTNVYEEMEQQLVIAPMFERIQVDAKTFRIPIANEEVDDYVAQFASGTYATGVGDTTNVPTSDQHAIVSVDFTPHKFMVTTHLAKDEEEDTILPLIDFLRRAATRRLSRSIDKAILRGTGALTGFTANPAGTSTYASVVKGVVTMVNQVAADGLIVRTADATTKASAANIAALRAKMGKYGLQLGDHLVYLTTIEGYNELVTTSDFRTVDKFGPNATYLTGSVGAVYGIPVVITEFLDNVGSNSNIIGAMVYKPGFMIAERRGIEIESEYEPRQQVTAMYLSTRFDLKALSTVGSGANLSATYGMAGTVRTLA